MAPRIIDLRSIEVEHLVGEKLLREGEPAPGLVMLRIHLSTGDVAIAHLRTGQARQIAGHILDAAARGDYEGDLCIAARAADIGDDQLGAIMHLVRNGETRRHTLGGGS